MRAKNSGARQRKKGTDGRNQHLQQANSSASSRSLSRDPVSTSDNVHDHDHDRSEDCVHDHGQDRGHDHGHDHHHHNEPNVFVVFMIFNVCVAAFMYAAYYLIQNPFFITSCNAEQPLVDIKDNFLSKEVFGELVECLHSHPLVVGNELDGKNFKGTRGFVIKFSEEGITDFRAHRYFACLAPYFDAVRFPRANAFVMNLLICEFASGNDDSNKNGLAVGTHLDNTIAIRSWRHFLAHQVNVLYAVVPKDMTGGGRQQFLRSKIMFEHNTNVFLYHPCAFGDRSACVSVRRRSP